jgi:hypothetical protein
MEGGTGCTLAAEQAAEGRIGMAARTKTGAAELASTAAVAPLRGIG